MFVLDLAVTGYVSCWHVLFFLKIVFFVLYAVRPHHWIFRTAIMIVFETSHRICCSLCSTRTGIVFFFYSPVTSSVYKFLFLLLLFFWMACSRLGSSVLYVVILKDTMMLVVTYIPGYEYRQVANLPGILVAICNNRRELGQPCCEQEHFCFVTLSCDRRVFDHIVRKQIEFTYSNVISVMVHLWFSRLSTDCYICIHFVETCSRASFNTMPCWLPRILYSCVTYYFSWVREIFVAVTPVRISHARHSTTSRTWRMDNNCRDGNKRKSLFICSCRSRHGLGFPSRVIYLVFRLYR